MKYPGKKIILEILKIFMIFHYITPDVHQIVLISIGMRHFIDMVLLYSARRETAPWEIMEILRIFGINFFSGIFHGYIVYVSKTRLP